MLKDYQKQFIELSIEKGVLQFGKYKLKSGRESPYFFNSGLFDSGESLELLGRCYSEALIQSGIKFDMLIGPAYKGIPLVSSTAIALSLNHGIDVPYAYNRKETKTHGESGDLVGAPLQGKVVIVDDVITAGTAIREIIALMEKHNITPTATIVAIDRQETGLGKQSAITEVAEEFGLTVISLVKLSDIVEYLEQARSNYQTELSDIKAYHAKYGAAL